MSTCISEHGEYSEHVPGTDWECRHCGVFDEAGVLAEVERLKTEVEAALSDGAAVLTNAMLRQDELQVRAEKAEHILAAIRREVASDNDRRMSLLIIGALVCEDQTEGVWDGTPYRATEEPS